MRNRSENSKEQAEGGTHLLRLDVRKAATPPSFFQCPISLEVMRSPVSLCTGVTYDRSSIQRWLDCGNRTCPATMQPLPSTDLVPNLTLRRLIHLWSTPSDHPPSLSDIAAALSDPDNDDAYKMCLLSSNSLRPSALASLFLARETVGLAANLVSLILSLDLVDAERRRAVVDALLADIDATFSGIVFLLKESDDSCCRIAAAVVLENILSTSTLPDSKVSTAIFEKPDLITELVRLIGERDAEVVDAGLRCLIRLNGEDLFISSPSLMRMMRVEMVRSGVVSALVNVMETERDEIPAAVAERAMRVMETVAGCGEGKAAICADAGRLVEAVVGRMIEMGNEGREATVSMLWRMCCAGGGDRRAREAATAAKGGLAKMLVVMQGVLSPSGRRMAGDLIRVFRANAESSMAAAG